jgi:phosphatidate cytidylyltransferase
MLIVIFLPFHHHLALNILLIVFSSLGGIEFSLMLKKKGLILSRHEAAILGALCTFAMTLSVSFGIKEEIFLCSLAAAVAVISMRKVISGDDGLESATNYCAAGFSVLLYPGFFLSWIILINQLEYADILIVMFLLIVLGNDSLAWFFGMLFGKGNRGIIKASPNKSIAGFAGGLLTSVAVGLLTVKFYPEIFGDPLLPAVFCGPILGFTTGIAAILGDLAESAMKRSCGQKDSGFIMPGRGGILDSLDSLAFSAPVFYIVYRILY